MAKVSIHANNLINPNHMEWTNDGRLLVSEFSVGRVKDITDGGDMSDVKALATGLSGPASILPLHCGKILVAENWAGQVSDISKGGDVSKITPYVSGLSNPYSLLSAGEEEGSQLLVSEFRAGDKGWISDISDPQNVSTFLDNIPVRPTATDESDDWRKHNLSSQVIFWLGSSDGANFLSVGSLGQIVNITGAKGSYSELLKDQRAVAWDLGRLAGFKQHPRTGLIYVTEPTRGDVVAVNPKGAQSMHFDPPVVRGFNRPTCVRFSADGATMYVCAQGDGVVWKVTEFD